MKKKYYWILGIMIVIVMVSAAFSLTERSHAENAYLQVSSPQMKNDDVRYTNGSSMTFEKGDTVYGEIKVDGDSYHRALIINYQGEEPGTVTDGIIWSNRSFSAENDYPYLASFCIQKYGLEPILVDLNSLD